MDTNVFAIVLIIVASFFQGSFGLGMKYMNPLKWEAWWLVHSIFAMIIIPTIWASLVVPDLFNVIAQAPLKVKILAMLFGAMWGVGGILFGKSVPYIGMSLTYGIVLGLCAAAGSLIPFFIMDNPNMDTLPTVLTGVVLLVVGVGVTAYAGIEKDKMQKAASENGSENKVNLKTGLMIAILSGLLSAALSVGFSEGKSIAGIAEQAGALTRNSSLAVWVVVLWGGFIINGGYAVFLLTKNKTWSSFSVAGSKKAYTWSIIAAIFWFGALGVYGQGNALMGAMGDVVGWPILMGGGLIISNIWAYRSGEWTNVPKPFRILLAGIGVIVIAICVLAYSNTL